MSAPIDEFRYKVNFKKLSDQLQSARNFKEMLTGLRTQILSLYNVEMATIYLTDAGKKEIFSWLALPGDHLKKIRIPINSDSIAGFVAKTGKIVDITDVYNRMELTRIDKKLSFDASWDAKTGVKTKNVLAVPVVYNNSLLGVIQLINKKDEDSFSSEDRKYAFNMSATLGSALYKQYEVSNRVPTRYDFLIKNGIISHKELDRAMHRAKQQGKEVESILMREFGVTRLALGNALAKFYGVPYVDLSSIDYETSDIFKGINLEYFRKTHCLPIAKEGGKITLAIDDPNNQEKIQEIMQILRASDAEFRLALKIDIEQFVRRVRSSQKPVVTEKKTNDKSVDEILEEMRDENVEPVYQEELGEEHTEDRAIVLLVRKIIEDAHEQNASDIHIEPYGYKRDAEVRIRVDGTCSMVLKIPKGHIRSVVSRLKILAKLDIAERRKPQDGKIKFKASQGKEVELRVSTIPTADGNEDVVLRILASSEPLPLKDIMPRNTFETFSKIIQNPYGIVLVVGPTGSGKTTTLHSALGFINTPEKKIWTAEDPVEITQYRLRQVQINSKIGLTFAAAMRAFLRADPDVIMVGEMRDQETVSMGIEASLTGHLVFSTLHTNSAPETVVRLIDMGMDPFNFADALLGILAQRLVRTLCPSCKVAYHPDKQEYDHLKKVYGPLFDKRINTPYTDGLLLHKASGCKECKDTGYKGRMGLYELLVCTDTIKKLIIDRAMVEKVREAALVEGMSTLLMEGISSIFAGKTDYKQVISVCQE